MTMRELAKIANVSVSTVSKAFNDAEDVSAETKRYIYDIAKSHGCFGKYYKGKFNKKIIAVICPELTSAFYNGYVERLQKTAEEHNAVLLISTNRFSGEKQEELMEYYASYLRVDGIFTFGLGGPIKKGYDCPVVNLLYTVDAYSDSICQDLETPILEALNHLKSLGHRRIAFIGESLTRSKQQLYVTGMKAIGLSPEPVIVKSRFEQAGEEGVHQLWKGHEPPTALLCGYDDIAFGAIKALKRKGFSVPEDVSVIGIDNVRVASYMSAGLTSIDSCPDKVCVAAWELMDKKQENRFFSLPQCKMIPGRLILRETTGPVKK